MEHERREDSQGFKGLISDAEQQPMDIISSLYSGQDGKFNTALFKKLREFGATDKINHWFGSWEGAGLREMGEEAAEAFLDPGWLTNPFKSDVVKGAKRGLMCLDEEGLQIQLLPS